MKPKTLVLMVVAVTCGLGASYMTSRLLAERSSDDAPKVKVLVAKKNMNVGELLKVPQDVFEEKEFAEGTEPREAIVKFDELKGRTLKRSLRVGDFIRTEDTLDVKDPASMFAGNLPQGYRAMGLRVNLESIAAGFASLPHSRVDIINTVRRGDDTSSYAQILLENVLVLASDQNTMRDESGRAMPANIVTVALSPEDVLKLNMAREMGTLSLALRKFNDFAKAPIDKMTITDVRSGAKKSEGEEAVGAEAISAPPVAALPALPPLKAEDAKPAPKSSRAPLCNRSAKPTR